MTTTKTNAELLAEGRAQRGAELLAERVALRDRVEEILRLDNARAGKLTDVYDLGPSDDDRHEGGPHGLEHGTTYRIVVAGAEEEPGALREPEPRTYLTLDHAILALVAHRNGNGYDSYAAATDAARALGLMHWSGLLDANGHE